MKSTAIAPSNIAFIKYWGKKDEALRLPENGSISMCLSNLTTTTTVEFDKKYKDDEIVINDIKLEKEAERGIKHLDRIRKLAGLDAKAKVVTQNNFPTGTGLSSSASGFAALTLSAVTAAGLKLSEKELSILARQGSGSSCRSIPDGFVEWLDGDTSDTSYAISIYPPEYWDIVDIVAIVSEKSKEISSSEGSKTTSSNPFFSVRKSRMIKKIKELKKFLAEKNFLGFGKIIEKEALELHAIYLTSGLLYLLPETLNLMKLTRQWRGEGLPLFFTLNTGQNIHLICQKMDVDGVVKKLQGVSYVSRIIVNFPSKGARTIDTHLF